MGRLALLTALMALVPLLACRAGELTRTEPHHVGLSAGKLAELPPALRNLVDEGKVAGGVALIARHGRVAYVEPFGYRDLASKAPMTEDTIFAIASMSKPITCVATMALIEQGKLGLDDPVETYLPALKAMRVLGDPADDDGDEIATVPSQRPITVRDLLTHTSGLSYGGFLSGDARLARSYARAGAQRQGLRTIAEQVERLGHVALAHQPGEGWTYGLSHDMLGRLIEVVSGQDFDRYLHDRIFAPLEMRDTSFSVPEAQRDRMATIYRAGAGGALTALPRTFGSEAFFSGGGGLYSTARDYARFAQMLLNGGELDGVRILRPETIREMTTNQIGGLRALGGLKYGLGFGLELAPGAVGAAPALKRYLWGGLFSTDFWVDPRHDLVAVLMTQVLPTHSAGAERVFRRAVDAAIED